MDERLRELDRLARAGDLDAEDERDRILWRLGENVHVGPWVQRTTRESLHEDRPDLDAWRHMTGTKIEIPWDAWIVHANHWVPYPFVVVGVNMGDWTDGSVLNVPAEDFPLGLPATRRGLVGYPQGPWGRVRPPTGFYDRVAAKVFALGLGPDTAEHRMENPSTDSRLRRLERAAVTGDMDAMDAYVREAERAGVGRGWDEGSLLKARELRDMRKALGRPARMPERRCYVVEDMGEHERDDGRKVRIFNAYLDGRRISNMLVGERALRSQIDYDRLGLHPHSREDFWWNESIDREHYECPGCRPPEPLVFYGPRRQVKKTPRRRRRRRANPSTDERIRRLERLAATGDAYAERALQAWRRRADPTRSAMNSFLSSPSRDQALFLYSVLGAPGDPLEYAADLLDLVDVPRAMLVFHYMPSMPPPEELVQDYAEEVAFPVLSELFSEAARELTDLDEIGDGAPWNADKPRFVGDPRVRSRSSMDPLFDLRRAGSFSQEEVDHRWLSRNDEGYRRRLARECAVFVRLHRPHHLVPGVDGAVEFTLVLRLDPSAPNGFLVTEVYWDVVNTGGGDREDDHLYTDATNEVYQGFLVPAFPEIEVFSILDNAGPRPGEHPEVLGFL